MDLRNIYRQLAGPASGHHPGNANHRCGLEANAAGVLDSHLMRLAWHPYLAPRIVQSDLTGPMSRDAFGHRLHLAFALLFCFLLPWPMSIVQVAGVPLIIFFIVRTPHIWRTWGSFGVQPLFLAVVAFTAWQALSLVWSPDLKQGLRELSSNRWIWAMWMLWPVMMHRNLLIAALAAGFVCGYLAQLGHAIGLWAGIEWLTWPRLPDRNSGWWDPVVGGSMLVAALGLHLPAATMGRGRWRLVGLAGVAITLVAIFATGSRGAWIAGAGLVALVLCVAVGCSAMDTRRARGGRGPGLSPALGLAVVMLVAGIAGWVVLGDSVTRRYTEARQEITRVADGDYQTHTGARILMAEWAVAAVRARPLGVGAGGYRAWTQERLAERNQEHLIPHIHGHAHNAPLHIAATLGVVGIILAGAVAALALSGGLSQLNECGGLGSYASGPAFALVGLFMVSAFDVVHLNGQTTPLLAALLGMCMISRPTLTPDARGKVNTPGATVASTIGPSGNPSDPTEGELKCPEPVPSATSRSTL